MQKNIQVGYDANKLKAIEQYMSKKNIALQSELSGFMDKLYDRYVPPSVREFIESIEQPSANSGLKGRGKKKTEAIENVTNYG